MITINDIEKGLIELGLRKGMYLEVHSSLSSFGLVDGGAATIIAALQKIVTSDGAIIMPSFPVTKPLPLTEEDLARGLTLKLRVLDPDSDERTGMGLIADTFRKLPDVCTGTGEHRVSAWGSDIEENSRGFSHLHSVDGYGLLLGVDIYRLTSMHYVEGNLPHEITDIFEPSEEVRRNYPPDRWVIGTGNPPEKAWYKIQEMAYGKGYIKDIMIGKAKCMFFKVNDVIMLYKDALQRDALGLYGIRKEMRRNPV